MSSIYPNPAVRMRLIEFLGGDSLDHATAAYITQSDGCEYDPRLLHKPGDLDYFLRKDLDIARSLADTASFLFHLDVEYVNFDSPAEAFVDPERTFDLQEPVVRVIQTLLLQWGIRPLHMITGQGHHFVWRISRNSELADRIAALCPAPELLAACEERVPPALQALIDRTAHQTFAAISLLMEYVAHRVKEAATPLSQFPVEITAVHVGPCASKQREIISIDISEDGDPLHTRMVRMPFTNYLKPWVTGLARSLGIEQSIPAIRTIPLHEIDIRQALKVRQLDADVIDLAHRCSVRIPEQTEGTARLLQDYLTSHLRQFHERFYSDQHDAKDRWPETYDRTPEELFPSCARHIVTWPNDLLLKPAGMQMITRCLLAAGWHPRHIAGFIRSKFENPAFNWGVNWADYVPAIRADFYTRLFAGLYDTGLDPLIDLNCTSTREKGFCFPPDGGGGCSLEPVRQSLAAAKEAIPTSWPIGLSTGCFYRHNILSVLDAIRDSGFREIEVCSFPAHLDYRNEADVQRAGEKIRALGLRPISFHAPFADRIDITSPDVQVREAAVAELITACRAATLLGAENIVLHPGPERAGRPPQEEFLQRMHHAAVSLNQVAAYCYETGVQLLLENMLPHLLFGQTRDMMFLLGEISTCTVGACLDTGHAQLSGDLGGVFHKLSGHLRMVHINDNHGDWDAHLIPGEGTIDWLWVINELRQHQFHGGLIIEMSAREKESVNDTLARARRGRDFLASILEAEPGNGRSTDNSSSTQLTQLTLA
jgi:sugar phosphate isomerase/epimerase